MSETNRDIVRGPRVMASSMAVLSADINFDKMLVFMDGEARVTPSNVEVAQTTGTHRHP